MELFSSIIFKECLLKYKSKQYFLRKYIRPLQQKNLIKLKINVKDYYRYIYVRFYHDWQVADANKSVFFYC